jgi:cytochrome c peroxidase
MRRRWLWLALSLPPFWPACAEATGAPPDDQAPHGAAAMPRQQELLATLVPAVDPAAVPPSVDRVMWAASIPPDNQLTAARVDLGRQLYFEPRLSADGTVACATCHDVTRSFTDRRPVSEGINGQLGRRNAPTVMNAALLHTQFLDGRAATLEVQALLPIINPIEMGQPDGEAAMAGIRDDAGYQQMFQAAYGRAPNYEDVGRAIAAFERTLIFLDTPFDRFLRGQETAVSDDVKAGWALFNGKGRCATCHPINAVDPIGSDDRFHNIGVSARHQRFGELAVKAIAALGEDASLRAIDELALDSDASELGRFLVTRSQADIGGFRTLQIRNVGITAPYMHDGSMQTLWDVMDHYNKGGEPNRFLDGGIEPLALTEAELEQLVLFMFALTDDRFATENARELHAQRARAAQERPFRDDDLAMRRALPFETDLTRRAP